MAHGTATNSIELSGDAKSFDRMARKWNVDYAFYKTGPDKFNFVAQFSYSNYTIKLVNNSTATLDYMRKVRTVFCPDFLAQS